MMEFQNFQINQNTKHHQISEIKQIKFSQYS